MMKTIQQVRHLLGFLLTTALVEHPAQASRLHTQQDNVTNVSLTAELLPINATPTHLDSFPPTGIATTPQHLNPQVLLLLLLGSIIVLIGVGCCIRNICSRTAYQSNGFFAEHTKPLLSEPIPQAQTNNPLAPGRLTLVQQCNLADQYYQELHSEALPAARHDTT